MTGVQTCALPISDTATDTDYLNIDRVVAHEYFHNWTGDRVTCRDWFQLSLKEGFTVFRDQSFSADQGSAAVKRIEDVRSLRAAQFPEDSGPLAHPVRPESYIEISNFYTATIYNKGAEVIRMLATILGREKFRAATDLYFDRFDGTAATCEDFVVAMEDASGIDLDWFWRGWFYSVDHVDLAIENVRWLQLDSRDPAVEKPKAKAEKDAKPVTTTRRLNAELPKRLDRFPELRDFYDNFDESAVLPSEQRAYETLIKDLQKAKIDPALLKTARNFYLIEFANRGGIVMPLPLRLEYVDGTVEERLIGADIWRYNTEKCAKLIMTPKEIGRAHV